MFSSKLKADDITVKQDNTHFKNGYDIHIPFNEITLGYMFQYSILKNHFKNLSLFTFGNGRHEIFSDLNKDRRYKLLTDFFDKEI